MSLTQSASDLDRDRAQAHIVDSQLEKKLSTIQSELEHVQSRIAEFEARLDQFYNNRSTPENLELISRERDCLLDYLSSLEKTRAALVNERSRLESQLQSRQNAPTSSGDTAHEIKQLSQKVDQLQLVLLHPRDTSTESKPELGARLALACPPGPGLLVDDNTPSVLTEEQQSKICAVFESHIPKENTLVALLTPYLTQLCDQVPGAVLVNSESIPWVHSKSGDKANYQKPDLFMCHKSALIYGNAPIINDKSSASAKFAHQFRSQTFIFGECAWALRDSVQCIFEAKVQLSDSLHKELGEIYPKMQNLLRGPLVWASSKCCLFDKHMVHLLEFTLTGLRSRNQFTWTAPGSKDALLAFLRPNPQPMWVKVLTRLCEEFKVQLYPMTAVATGGDESKVNEEETQHCGATGSCFLGHGSTGRVFAVQRIGEPSSPLALKIADTPDHVSMLEAEQAKLIDLNQRLTLNPNPALKRYLPDLERVSECKVLAGRDVSGAGFMFGPVGRTVQTLPRNRKLFNQVTTALFTLHQAGITHGDPRMPNLLQVNDQLVWIDFRRSGRYENEGTLLDFCTCLNSFFSGSEELVKVNSKLDQLTTMYHQLVTCTVNADQELINFQKNAWDLLNS